jgi:hypothetical protein
MEEMTWRKQTDRTSKALELRVVERLGVIFLITKDGGFWGPWSVPIKSIKMFRSKAFSARPAYFLSTLKSRPDIAMDLCHGKKGAYSSIVLIDRIPLFD